MSNADVAFGEGLLTLKSYTTKKALSITKWVQLVDPKEFVIAALDIVSEAFIVYIAIREQEEMAMNSDKKAQIEGQSGAKSKIQVGALILNKAVTEVLAEYSNYNNIFLAENTVELSEHTKINNYAIKLEKDKQLLFKSIYSLGQVELETLKTYIKTNLADSFI